MMKSITLNWLGPFSLNQTTPKELQRKMGIYAIVHGFMFLFIGKAKYGKGLFREATQGKEREYWEGLRKLHLVSGDMPSHYRLMEDIYKYCELYAGIVSRDEIDLVDEAERFIVYKVKPVCNVFYVKYFERVDSFQVMHKGHVPPGLTLSLSMVDGKKT